ncbi:MAG: ABC transporter permease subunit [Alphaproteobacteria bacterium]|jgi:multiple sugar transport system permease protein|nr:ABC transporter permease subunit [Alphaproteobacteria bacterium]
MPAVSSAANAHRAAPHLPAAPRALFAAAVLGALACLLAVGLWSLMATLAGGQGAGMPLDLAAVTGALQGVAFALIRPRRLDHRHAEWAAAVLGTIVFLGLSGLRPFGLGLVEAWFWALPGTVVVGWSTAAMIRAAFAGLSLAEFRRLQIETVVVRAVRGFGIAFFTVMVAFPFYVMVVASLKPQGLLMADPLDLSIDVFQPLGELFGAYVEVFTAFNFGRYILVSTFVSVTTVVVTLLLAIPGAYAVARLRFPGRVWMSQSILLVYMFPAIVLVIPLYSVFSLMGLRDSLLGLLIVYPATTLPVALYMLQGYFRGLPHELEEAGLIDGASRVGVILRITLPLSLPALASVALYVFMIAWNEFLFAFMFLDDPAIFTLSRGIVSLDTSEVPRQYLMAGSVIVTVPVMAIFLYFERFLVTGLTAGSVKG